MVVEEALDDDDGGDGADYDEKVVEKIAGGAQVAHEEKSSAPWTPEPDAASLHIT